MLRNANTMVRRIIRPMVLFMVLLAIAPFFSSHPFYRHVLTMIFLFAAVSEAWNLISGYAGLFSLAHAAFFGVGAYTTVTLYVDYGISPWLGLPIGGIAGVVVAVIIGFTTFRLRSYFFVLATLACSEAIHVLFTYWRIRAPTGLGTTVPRDPGIMKLTFASELPYTLIAYSLMTIVVLVSWIIVNSRVGFYLRAIEGDEDAALSLGVNTSRVKLLIISISAFFTGIGGGFYGMYMHYIEPEIVFSVDLMIQYIVFAIVGGMATIPGPIIGTLLLLPLTIFFRSWIGGLFSPLGFFVYGILLIVMIILAPGGIMQGINSLSRRMLRKVPAPSQRSSGAL
jgi:branched-chain amino acid transport system permease protein